METGRAELEKWYDEGVRRGATHMIVVCDTFSWEDRPVFVMPGENARDVAAQYDGVAMQRIHEVYSLSLDKERQLAERRAVHYE